MNRFILFFLIILFFTPVPGQAQKKSKSPSVQSASNPIQEFTNSMKKFDGYFPFYWDEKKGDIWLEISEMKKEFLYLHSLPGGVGSNDIGLDRGQLGSEKVVFFERSGPKVLLVQPNYRYRSTSTNPAERQSVEEAFAKSVIWGFEVKEEYKGTVLVNASSFFLRDAHEVEGALKQSKQGNYRLDLSRSALYLENIKNFPKNSEFEAQLTFTGEPEGGYIRSVTPTPEAVTVRQHHSFIELPGPGFEPRVWDPRCGYFSISYQDYSAPIGQNMTTEWITRHRLKKKNPEAAISEAEKPIVYYLDPGAPEPVKSALLEGASWWNHAFESAGYRNAFQVKELPAGADIMDVRYNVIQWVHRSTRGWSYGASVTDPRTGEIIKGHVSLGSLRVRQDYLIAQGILSPFEEGREAPPEMLEMALARLRQLSAHEVGHTIGLAHNFAASVNGRASVMDYPHPFIQVLENGKLDFFASYTADIGEWDHMVVRYGYTDFANKQSEEKGLNDIINEMISKDLLYISDQDARPQGGSHPYAHLWDNGPEPIRELTRIGKLRAQSLMRFGLNSIPSGSSMEELEKVLVPLYLSHRYQVEAAVKMIGGMDYSYAVKGDGQVLAEIVDAESQKMALDALLNSLDPGFLVLPENILSLITPPAPGHFRGREHFKSRTGPAFDPLSAAESSAYLTISLLLHPSRLARVIEHRARDSRQLSLPELLKHVSQHIRKLESKSGMEVELARVVEKVYLMELIKLAGNEKASPQVRAIALMEVKDWNSWMEKRAGGEPEPEAKAHYGYLIHQIDIFLNHPSEFSAPPQPDLPDGSPIGCGM